MSARKSRRRAGFYRKALAQREESGDGGTVDVGEIKQRLIEEMRRRPGELHLLLQGSKVVLRAAALEHRLSQKEGRGWRIRSPRCTPSSKGRSGCSDGGEAWLYKGKQSVYRYHIEDPIHFRESIRVTIEHGHANNLSNDYSSTAYWCQTEPHAPPPALPPPEGRLPR